MDAWMEDNDKGGDGDKSCSLICPPPFFSPFFLFFLLIVLCQWQL